uniref:NADH-ubiquinone oxidoreductase chain 2 n=1 Tax=Eolachesilla chilensis TaxID=297977 RepID=A0A8K1ZFE3_9NEOP|nr:NADH dehydrogenase subunit 2 [Eolachesilla chilensis]
MFNNLNLLFLLMTTAGSILAVSSPNWLGTWMGLEMNMLSFVPLMIEQKNMFSNESALKYFLIQSSASALFLMFCVMNMHSQFSFFAFNPSLSINFGLTIPLLIKLGASPFQSWFIMVMEGLTWFKSFLLMTWQKIAPLFILSFVMIPNQLLSYLAIMSLMVGSIGGLTQTSLRKILAFSSVNHLGWMFSSLMISKTLTTLYFLFYSVMNLLILLHLKMNFIFQLTQIYSKPQLISFSVSLLSLGGLPPFLGFLPKWMIIQPLIFNNSFFLCFILVMTALITLFYYLHLIYMNLIMLSFTQKYNSSSYNQSPTIMALNAIMVTVAMSGLILFNLILT